jgi:hypothetical protein
MEMTLPRPVKASTSRTRGEGPASTKRPAVSYVVDVCNSTKKPITAEPIESSSQMSAMSLQQPRPLISCAFIRR